MKTLGTFETSGKVLPQRRGVSTQKNFILGGTLLETTEQQKLTTSVWVSL